MCETFAVASFAVINIQADKASYNYKTRIYTYVGHVKITETNPEMTTKLTGDTIMITNSPNQKIQKIIALGNLAHYDTLPRDKQHPTRGQAQRIEIYPPQQKIILVGKGKMFQDNNSFAGPRLEYFIKKQTLMAFPSKQNQTVIVIQPSRHS